MAALSSLTSHLLLSPVWTSAGGADQAPALTWSVVADATTRVVHLSGELDVVTAPLLVSVITEQSRHGHLDLRVDLSGVSFCDLRGLAALRAAQQQLTAAGGRLTVLHPSALLQRVAGLFGMQALFETVA